VSGHSVLTDLVRRGKRLQVRNLLIHESSFALALALGGAIVLLLVGTQILNWYWPVLLYVGALIVGIWRAKSKILSNYQVAQSIDQQLGFHDSLSTAFFFAEHPTPEIYPAEFVDQQRAVAEDMARTADLRRGIPFHMPRTLYANALLLAAVCGMFGLRYGVNRNMDLRSSLIPISFDGFLGPSAKELAAMKKIAGQHPFDQDGHRENGNGGGSMAVKRRKSGSRTRYGATDHSGSGRKQSRWRC